MPLMPLPILNVFLSQNLPPNHQEVLSILFFRSLVKLKEPLFNASPSSIFTGIPAFARNVDSSTLQRQGKKNILGPGLNFVPGPAPLQWPLSLLLLGQSIPTH